MRILVTGSSGHLGEALVRQLRAAGHTAVGLDRLPSAFTDEVGSIADQAFVGRCVRGADAVLHAATLHKPHVVTHSRQAFVDTNVTGTLNLLEAAAREPACRFVFTSTTSVFGRALRPPAGEPAVWVTEELAPVPKNVYGVTKLAAEGLCELVHRERGLACLVLRTSRFFLEEDDDAAVRARYAKENVQANELLNRRVELQDLVDAHLLALEHAPRLGFERFVVSATTPFEPGDLDELRRDAPAVVRRRHPEVERVYARLGWSLPPSLDRVYDNRRARELFGWRPRTDFGAALARLDAGEELHGPLARAVGSKPYHDVTFEDGPYPVG